jgi:hypothetical protein
MCKLSKIWAHQKLLPSLTEMHQMRRWQQTNAIEKKDLVTFDCVLCGGNHPANCKGCTVYTDLWKEIYPPLCLKICTPARIKQTLYTQRGVTYAQITKQNSYTPTNIEQEPRINHLREQTSDIQGLVQVILRPTVSQFVLVSCPFWNGWPDVTFLSVTISFFFM